jgi:ubiquinone/menaquinone biosynthesis C-methylase UbiE/uncharacterized protein YbaR (Trm112 family)
MKWEIVEYFCCPACRGGLELKAGEYTRSKVLSGELQCQGCSRSYKIDYGLPNLVYPDPEGLPEIDAKFLKQYERIAASYDLTIRWGALLLFGVWEPRTRKLDLIQPLELAPGDRVLEVGAGTGSNLPIIAKQIGEEGKLFALDLSPGMLAVARERLKRKGIEAEFTLGNGAYLPYKDDMFDAVLHFGGINTFGEKTKAIAEIVRVAKPGARIVIGDEGLAPAKEKTIHGRLLLKLNSLYANKPPTQLVPEQIESFCLKWIFRGTFYVMQFRKALSLFRK